MKTRSKNIDSRPLQTSTLTLVIEDIKLICRDKKVAIATSGGLDSLSLCFLVKAANIDFTSLIIDHKYRSNSSSEAKEVSKYLEQDNIKNVILKNNSPTPLKNIEEELRTVRYELLYDYCKSNQVDILLFGHHADDQIETFLMRLERGSGLKGLSSIKKLSKYRDLEIYRPLLSVDKKSLESYASKNNLKWFEDKTNESEDFKRNKVRKLLSQLDDYDLIKKNILNSISALQSSEEYISRVAEKHFEDLIKINQKGYTELDLVKFNDLDNEIKNRVLRKAVEKLSHINKNIRQEKLEIIICYLTSDNHQNTSQTAFGLEFIKKDSCKAIIIHENNKLVKLNLTSDNFVWNNLYKIKQITAPNNKKLKISCLNEQDIKQLKDQNPELYTNVKNKEGLKWLKSTPVIKIKEGNIEKTAYIPYIGYYSEEKHKNLIVIEYLPFHSY